MVILGFFCLGWWLDAVFRSISQRCCSRLEIESMQYFGEFKRGYHVYWWGGIGLFYCMGMLRSVKF